MPNTISGSLVLKHLEQAAVPLLTGSLAPLRAFAQLTDMGVVRLNSVASIEVPKVTVAPSVQSNPADWESGNFTLANIPVAPVHLSISAHLLSSELQGGARIEMVARSLSEKLAQAVFDEAAALVTTANFGAATVTAAAASFGVDDVATLTNALLARNRCLVLATPHFTAIAPNLQPVGGTWGLPGFAGGIHEVASLTAGTNVVGWAAAPSAIAGALATPETPAGAARGEQLAQRIVALPDIGVNCLAAAWTDIGKRIQWVSLELVVAFAVGDSTALKIVVSS